MLMANETVAEEFFWREIPFLYRTHEAPDEDRIRQLSGAGGGMAAVPMLSAMGVYHSEPCFKNSSDTGFVVGYQNFLFYFLFGNFSVWAHFSIPAFFSGCLKKICNVTSN